MFTIDDIATVAIQGMPDGICVTSFVALKGVSSYDLFTALIVCSAEAGITATCFADPSCYFLVVR